MFAAIVLAAVAASTGGTASTTVPFTLSTGVGIGRSAVHPRCPRRHRAERGRRGIAYGVAVFWETPDPIGDHVAPSSLEYSVDQVYDVGLFHTLSVRIVTFLPLSVNENG